MCYKNNYVIRASAVFYAYNMQFAERFFKEDAWWWSHESESDPADVISYAAHKISLKFLVKPSLANIAIFL